ncbi:sugar nucleotide-binding protein [Candidatus Pelagibacter sp.]|nr:sugar nucleotide-binding protein [Candidatus Pelagibacter sp.]
MKPNIIILGTHGMLGWQVLNQFKDSNFNLKCQVRSKKNQRTLVKKLKLNNKISFFNFDLEKDKIEVLYKKISKNDIIINCIGKIKPFINENNLNQIEAAIKVNSMFPLLLSKMIKIKNVKIYQIATDCVFSGSDGNYNEMSKHDALDVYGKSKSLGEVNIKNFFNIRASIIGKELDTKNSLVEWFLSNEKKEKIFGFKDHLWNGVSTSVFSQILYTIINEKINIPNNFHLVPKDKVSKYKLMQFLKNYYGFKDLKIIRKNSNNKINRVLETSHKLVNNEIWLKTKYKKKLSIKEIISTL